jgi:hypothetical protein
VVNAVKTGLDWFQANRTAIVSAPIVTAPQLEE